MKLKTLKISNFFSFGSNQIIKFEKYGNLVLVKGELDSDGNSNGAGKSSLFESIFWCLTGKTVRGVRAGDVVRIGEKEVTVEVTFKHLQQQITIKRFWSASKKEVVLIVDNKEERFHDSKQGTERVFETLGITPEILSLVIFYGKKFNTFSDLSPKDRAGVIDLLAQGQKWEYGREAATKKVKLLENDYDHTKQLVDNLLTRYENGCNEIDDYKTQLNELKEQVLTEERKVAERLKLAETHYEELKELSGSQLTEEIIECKQLILSAKETKATIKNDSECKLNAQVEELDLEIKQVRSLLSELDSEIFKAMSDVDKAQSVASDIRRKKGRTTCITCNQQLPNPPDNEQLEQQAALSDKETNELQTELSELKADKSEVSTELTGLELELSVIVKTFNTTLNEELDAPKKAIQQLEQQLEQLTVEQTQAASKLANALKAVEVEKSALHRVKNNSGVIRLETTIDNKEIEVNKFKNEGIKFEEDLTQLDNDSKLAKYWAQGFKDLRFAAFNNTIKTLQELLTAFCSQQGLDFDSIEVTSFKEGSSGKTIPEINIYVIRGNNRMGLDALSEGETQRVDLACYFTFSMLIEKSIGFPVDLNVLDEPLSGLDYEGRQSVFNIISELSAGKQLFVIDHDANFQDLFNDVIVVKKEGGLSHIEKQS